MKIRGADGNDHDSRKGHDRRIQGICEENRKGFRVPGPIREPQIGPSAI